MNYDTDGHRVKGKIDAIDWLHARLMKKQGKQASDFHLRQCLFGEHLLPKRPKDIVCLTEERKSRYYRLYCIPRLRLGVMWWETRSYTGKM